MFVYLMKTLIKFVKFGNNAKTLKFVQVELVVCLKTEHQDRIQNQHQAAMKKTRGSGSIASGPSCPIFRSTK